MNKKKKVVVENNTQKTPAKFPVKYDGIVKINDKKLIDDFVCAKCLKSIKVGERFVVLGTYELKEKKKENLNVGFVSEYFYHLSCWIEHSKQKVTERLMNSQSQAMELMKNNPMISNLIKNAGLDLINQLSHIIRKK